MGPVEALWDGDGVPPPPKCEQTETSPPVVLRTQAVVTSYCGMYDQIVTNVTINDKILLVLAYS